MKTFPNLTQAREIANNMMRADKAVSAVEMTVDLGSVTMSIWFTQDGRMLDHNPADR